MLIESVSFISFLFFLLKKYIFYFPRKKNRENETIRHGNFKLENNGRIMAKEGREALANLHNEKAMSRLARRVQAACK